MLVSDVVAAVSTLVLFAFYASGNLELWHIYVTTFVGATANTFQDPAWNASIAVLVPKSQLGRANGLVQLNQGLSGVLAPALAGALIAISGLGAILIIDVVTFGAGVLTLAIVRFPSYERMERKKESVLDDLRFAWSYLTARMGLLGLLWIYAGVNFMMSAALVLEIPLIASFSSETAAGVILSIAGVGAVAGSLVVTVFGVPKRLVVTILGGIFVSGILISLMGMRASLALIAFCTAAIYFLSPIVNSASQVVWQTKVAEGVQGRVFSLRFMIGRVISPLAIFIAGPLADRVFEPMMSDDGVLADSIGAVIGTGPGRGIGLIFVLGGLGTIGLAVAGWSSPGIRNIETELPDLAGRE
jgi:MFS family permease